MAKRSCLLGHLQLSGCWSGVGLSARLSRVQFRRRRRRQDIAIAWRHHAQAQLPDNLQTGENGRLGSEDARHQCAHRTVALPCHQMRGNEFADAWQRLRQPLLPDEALYRTLDIVIEEFRSRRGLLAPYSAATAACRALRSRSVCGRTRMPFST